MICFIFIYKAIHICLKGELDSIAELDEEDSGKDDICKRYLHEASLVLDYGCTRGNVDKFFRYS